jgi:hypothetical protein
VLEDRLAVGAGEVLGLPGARMFLDLTKDAPKDQNGIP